MSDLLIQDKVKSLLSSSDKSNFVYDFLLAFDHPKSTIERRKKNKSQNQTVLIFRNQIYFYKLGKSEDADDVICKISESAIIRKFSIKYIIVTDFNKFLSKDIFSNSLLNINFIDLHKNLDFFLHLNYPKL